MQKTRGKQATYKSKASRILKRKYCFRFSQALLIAMDVKFPDCNQAAGPGVLFRRVSCSSLTEFIGKSHSRLKDCSVAVQCLMKVEAYQGYPPT